MLQPERFIRDCFNLVRSFQHPALAPAVDDSIALRSGCEKSERNFKDDGIDVDPRLAVSAVVYKTIVAIFIFEKLVAAPRERALRQFSFFTVISPLRIIGIAIEEMIAFELDQGL